jgi:hypothetical protein
MAGSKGQADCTAFSQGIAWRQFALPGIRPRFQWMKMGWLSWRKPLVCERAQFSVRNSACAIQRAQVSVRKSETCATGATHFLVDKRCYLPT